MSRICLTARPITDLFDNAFGFICVRYRGCRSRRYLNELNEKATVIQRIWRGHSARKIWRQMVRLEVYKLKVGGYDAIAQALIARLTVERVYGADI